MLRAGRGSADPVERPLPQESINFGLGFRVLRLFRVLGILGFRVLGLFRVLRFWDEEEEF